MSMRVQLSLLFDDKDLFDNFITPYKEEKMLHSVIIKCLSAYYRDADIREKIEGIQTDDGEDYIKSSQEICDNIRQTLAIQDFVAQNLMDSLENAAEDINNILSKSNQIIRESNMSSEHKSEYGGSILQLESKENNNEKGVNETETKHTVNTEDNIMQTLIRAVISLSQAVGKPEITAELDGKNTETTSETIQKTESLTSEVQDVIIKSDKKEEIDDIDLDMDFNDEPTVQINTVPEVKVEEKETQTESLTDTDSTNDAKDAMSEFLNSLYD